MMRRSRPLRMGCSRSRKLFLIKNAIAPWLAIALCAASYAGTATFWFLRKSVKSGRFTRLVKAGFREHFGDHSVTPPPKPSIRIEFSGNNRHNLELPFPRAIRRWLAWSERFADVR